MINHNHIFSENRIDSASECDLTRMFCLPVKVEFSLFGSATDHSLQQTHYLSRPRTLLHTAHADEENPGKCSEAPAAHKQSNRG